MWESEDNEAGLKWKRKCGKVQWFDFVVVLPNEHLNATTIVLSLPLLKGTMGESMMKKEGLKDWDKDRGSLTNYHHRQNKLSIGRLI